MYNRDVSIYSDGIEITGRFYLPDSDNRRTYPVVCICHGIPSGNPPVTNDGGYPALAGSICERGYGVFIFNFRGCGTSEGNLDMSGWTRDLTAVIDYLYECPETDRSFLALLGFSAGAAVSVYVASEDKRVTAVVACSCPASFEFDNPSAVIDRFRRIGTIRDSNFPKSEEEWTRGFMQVRAEYCSERISPRPLVLLHGEEDEIVSISHALRIFDRAGEPKELFTIPGAGHKLRNNEKALEVVYNFLDSLR